MRSTRFTSFLVTAKVVLNRQIHTQTGSTGSHRFTFFYETQVVLVSEYDLVKQQVSRVGQNFDALDYLQAQITLDNPRLVVRENNQMTLWVSDAAGKWYAAVLQQTATGKGVFLKSFRRSSAGDALAQRKKGEVLLDQLAKE